MSKAKLDEYGLVAQRPNALDSSMVKDFLKCESYFYLRHILGMARKYLPYEHTIKFDWGTAWHKVMENYLKAKIDGGDGHDMMVAGLLTIEETFPDYITPENDKHGRSKDRMIEQFLAYHERYFKADKKWEVLRTEQYFHVYSEEDDLEYCGRMDGILRNTRTGELIVLDFKTSSSMGPSYFPSHEMGFQFPGYVWAANLISTEDIDKIMVDVMYTLKTTFDFFRRTFRYDKVARSEWAITMRRIVARINYMLDNHLYDPSAWIQNRGQCGVYGMCEFAEIHGQSPKGDARLRMLSKGYMVQRWDPSYTDEVD